MSPGFKVNVCLPIEVNPFHLFSLKLKVSNLFMPVYGTIKGSKILQFCHGLYSTVYSRRISVIYHI